MTFILNNNNNNNNNLAQCTQRAEKVYRLNYLASPDRCRSRVQMINTMLSEQESKAQAHESITHRAQSFVISKRSHKII